MIGTQLVYTNPGIQVLELAADWQDTVKEFLTWTNYAPHAVTFQRCEVINGTTAGSTTAGTVTVSTPNATYTVNGSATMAANQAYSVDGIGLDRIEEGETITLTLGATPPTSAKEFKVRLFLGPCGVKNDN